MTLRGRDRTRLSALLALAAVIAAALGCQAIVSSAVPDFRCSGSDPASCPAGMMCDRATQRCVSAASATPDASIEEEGTPPPDTDARVGTDGARDTGADSGPAPVGAGCRVNADCLSGLCGDGTLLSAATVAASGPVCTRTCCRSEDCPTGTICFGPGTGGRYCVPFQNVAGRVVTVGAGVAPGAGCSNGGQCRSGLCVGSKCVDVCCTNAQCTNGTTCRLAAVSGHDVFACGVPPGSGVDGDFCSGHASCTSSVCYLSTCRAPCCGAKTCQDLGHPSGRCSVFPAGTGNDSVNICLFTSSGSPNGATCGLDTDCKTEFCDPDTKKCADVCCADSDCAAFGTGFRCIPTTKPAANALRQLHCAKP